jgi:hypothetical protein
MSFIGATGLNTFDEEIENTSNYATRISLDSSNYTSNVNFNSSNYTSNLYINSSSNISLDSSNYTSNISLDSSNYTGRINNELSDRIGFPAALFPFQLPTGVYYPLKQQEVILGEVGNVVGLHTLAIAGIEEQIVGLVGTGGIIGIITGGFVGTALTTATNAQNTANSANNKVDNLIISTTTDKANTSNFIINTSNVISTRINSFNNGSVPTVANVFPLLYSSHFEQISDGLNPNKISIKNINSSGKYDYEFLKVPVAPADTIVNIQEPTSSPSVTKTIIDNDYKYMSFTFVSTLEYDIERMYPPVRNVSSKNHTISGQSYGNGIYIIDESSVYTQANGNFHPFNCFNTSDSIGGVWKINNYSAGVYINGTNTAKPESFDGVYKGDWIKIKLPVSIKLTSFQFKQRIGYLESPKDFKIYGSNNDTNWVELKSETNATYTNEFHDGTVSSNNTYNYFVLVVNKISNSGRLLNFDEWYIYGKSVLVPEENQTKYNITFSENTEVQLLLLDSTKYIQAVPFNISNSSLELIVGKNGSFSSFSGVSTGTNGITYGSGFVSNITGTSITYNSSLVIIRYKYTKIVTSTVQTTGFLNYTNADGWLVSQPLLSDLGGTITKNKISDFPIIPITLSDLTGTMLKNRISDFPTIPTQLSQLGGQIPVSTISDFPSIPNSFTKGELNQTLTSYGNSLIFTGSSFVSTNSFRIAMNFMSNFNYDNGFNARFYISCTVKSASDYVGKYFFGWVYHKFNNSNNTNNFRYGTIDADDISTWNLTYGGSSNGEFFLNIEIRATNPTITQLYVRIS